MLAGSRIEPAGKIARAVVFLVLVSLSAARAQQPSKEYVRLGGRVIAIENAAPNYSVSVTPASAQTGSADPQQFSSQVTPNQGSYQVTWSATPTIAGAINSNSGLFTPNLGISSQTSATITATVQPGGATGSTTLTVVPVLQPASASFSSAGSTDSTFQVTKAGAWTATVNSNATSWITLLQGGSGNGSGIVHFKVFANNTGQALSGGITVTGTGLPQNFQVTQDAGGALPSFSLSPSSLNVSGAPRPQDTNSVLVSVVANAPWMVTSTTAPWITTTPAPGQTQNTSGTISFTVAPNTTTSQRPGLLTVTDPSGNNPQSVTVTQGGPVTFFPTNASVASTNVPTGSITVTAPQFTSWQPTTDQTWIQVTSPTSLVSGGTVTTLTYSVQNNLGGFRTGHIIVGATQFTISQAAYTALSLLPTVAAAVTAGQVTLTAYSGATQLSPTLVTWAVVGGSAFGTITNGVYTAPNGVPSSFTAQISAVYQGNTAYASIFVIGGPGSTSVNLNPNASNGVNGQLTFFQMQVPYNGPDFYQRYEPLNLLFTNNAATSGSMPAAQNSCSIQWNFVAPNAVIVSLVNDTATGWSGSIVLNSSTTGGIGTIPNSQCKLDMSQFKWSIVGSTLNIYTGVMALAPLAGPQGTPNAYLASTDGYSGSGSIGSLVPMQVGTWGVLGYQAPTIALGGSSPTNGSTVQGSVTMQGYAYDANPERFESAISKVEVFVDNIKVGNATYAVAPPSPVALCSQNLAPLGCPNIGFTYVLDTTFLSNASHTIRVMATDADPVSNTAYVDTTVTVDNPLPVSPPVFSPAGGTYSTAQSVQISSATPGASIYYTTDGTTPTTSSTSYIGPISVTGPTTIRALAFKAGDTNSYSLSTYLVGVGTNWYSTGGLWTNRMLVTVDHTKVSGGSALPNFPVLISLTDPNLKSTGNGGHVGKSDGTDILFTDSSGSTKLNHEIESYNAATGQLIAWVKLPSLSPTSDTFVYAYFGNASASDQQNKTSVWDANYKAVWHLASGSPINTADTITGTTGTVYSATSGTGKVGSGVSLAGSAQRLEYASTTLTSVDQSDKTVSLWINPANLTNPVFGLVDKDNDNGQGTYSGWGLWLRNTGKLNWWAASNQDLIDSGSATIATNTWTYVTAAWSHTNKNVTFYINGVANSSLTNAAINELASGSNPLELGALRTNQYSFTGLMDEVRVSNTVRSADWTLTEYRNQSSPTTFITGGTTETFQGQTAAPSFSPQGGTYSSSQTVSLSTTTSGATIYYTTDGSVPTTASLVYSSPISVASTTTLRALVHKGGLTDNTGFSAYLIGAGTGWYSTGGVWTNRMLVTVDHTKVSGGSALPNFPVLISLTDPNLKSTGNGGHVGKSDGTDILFTDSSGSTKLNHEIESYNAATGQLIAWVKLPSLSPTSDTFVYAYFGNASASDQQNKTSVWDANYKAVWHLASGSPINTADTITGTTGTVYSATSGTGKVGSGVSLAGSAQRLEYASSTLTSVDQSDKTVSLWINPANLTNPVFGLVDKDNDNGQGTYSGWGLWLRNTGKLNWWAASNKDLIDAGSATVFTNTWTYVTVTWNYASKTATFYVNGSFNSNPSNNTISELPTGTNPLELGAARTNQYPFTGLMDEIRVSNMVRSSDWILTEYRNQSTPAMFTAEGVTESAPAGQVVAPTFSPTGGTYGLAQTVTISTTTSGASIYYTTDNSTPTTSSTLYTGPVTVASTLTLKAIGHKSGMTDSVVASAGYVISSAGSWYNNGWAHRKQITVNSGQVTGTQTNFPMLVSLTSDAQLIASARSDGNDILFTDSSGTTLLPFEIESYGSGTLAAWVQVSSLTTGSQIYMYYGNASNATSLQNKTGVWDSNYKGVWHLPNGTTLTATDSTTSGSNGTVIGSVTATAGQIGGAGSFNGSSYISAPTISVAGSVTASVWVNSATLTTQTGFFLAKGLNNNWEIGTQAGAGGVFLSGADGGGGGRPACTAPSNGAWHYVVGTISGTTGTVYVDGSQCASGTVTAVANTGDTINIGAIGTILPFLGSIDEARVSNIARSAAWIATEYNNQKTPGSFYALGSETNGGSGGSYSAVFSGTNALQAQGMAGNSAYSALTQWRFETRIHNLPATWTGYLEVFTVGNFEIKLLTSTATDRYLYLQDWTGATSGCNIDIGARTDITLRAQKDTSGNETLRVWDSTGTELTNIGCFGTARPGPDDFRGSATNGYFTIGGSPQSGLYVFQGDMAYFRFFSTSASPTAAEPADPATPADLLDYEFENNLTDSSGRSQVLTSLPSGASPTYVSSH